MEKKIVEVIAQTINVSASEINIKTGVGDIPDWDSLGHTSIIAALEEVFDIVFDIEEALDCETVEDMVEIINEKIS
jgi:acyl carrier protein